MDKVQKPNNHVKQEEHLILDIKNTHMPLETTTAIPDIQTTY
jgi:hypothetical protein